MFYFVTRKEANTFRKQDKIVIDVSSRGAAPYNMLSPFYAHGNIAVPGLNAVFSDSVEGVWQGLKVMDGKIDESFFKGRGRKRRGKPTGHLFNDTLIDYLSARKIIYVPTYREMVYKAPKARQLAIELLKIGHEQNVFIHDFDTNGEVENTSKPLAHASVLVNLLNENLQIITCFDTDEKFRDEYLAKINDEDSYKIKSPLAYAIIEETFLNKTLSQ